LGVLPKESAADEGNRWADPRSLAANEGLELGDAAKDLNGAITVFILDYHQSSMLW
jgi:hypothetical protein